MPGGHPCTTAISKGIGKTIRIVALCAQLHSGNVHDSSGIYFDTVTTSLALVAEGRAV